MHRGFNKSVVALLPFIALASCGPSKQNAAPRSYIDYQNDPRHFDINDKTTYDEIKSITTRDAKVVPWTDTYWPHVDRGLSLRTFAPPLPLRSSVGAGVGRWPNPGVASFLASSLAATEPRERALLSPAEKHDIMMRSMNNHEINLGSSLQEIRSLATLEDAIDATPGLTQKKALASEMAQRLSNSFLASTMPLSLQGWITWFRNSANTLYQFGNSGEGISWDWMGHCHGWAAAAIMEEVPKHSVLARFGNTTVLFTEGDIRGLLTKAWADNPIQGVTRFAGRRCGLSMGSNEVASLPTDAEGRALSGEIESPLFSGLARFQDIQTTPRWNPVLQHWQTVYTLLVSGFNQTVFYIDPQNPTEKALVFTSFLKLNRYLSNGDEGLGTPAREKFYGCQDTNPAAVHILLTKYLGQPQGAEGKPARLIMDRVPGGQVWNQPVYRADFAVGDLTPITAIHNDIRAKYRAAGTTYLAEVKTKVFWTAETDLPHAHYPEGFDEGFTYTVSYTYTLEFNGDKVLIGGEWGAIGSGRYTGWYPDFMWAYGPDSHPIDTRQINYSKIIKPLHNCSLSDGPTENMIVGGQSLRYTECVLDGVPAVDTPESPAPTAAPLPIGPEE